MTKITDSTTYYHNILIWRSLCVHYFRFSGSWTTESTRPHDRRITSKFEWTFNDGPDAIIRLYNVILALVRRNKSSVRFHGATFVFYLFWSDNIDFPRKPLFNRNGFGTQNQNSWANSQTYAIIIANFSKNISNLLKIKK